jgi:hypothetical protein
MNTSTLVVVPYVPVKDIPDYRQQFYTFIADFKERIERTIDTSIYPNIRIVVIDSLGAVILDPKPGDEQLREHQVPYGALLNSAYFIAKHSSTPFQRILFHEPFYMPNRNLLRLYFEYPGSGCVHYSAVYRDLFPRNYPYMGVFSVDTDLLGNANGFPTHVTDFVQIFERFHKRVRRFTQITPVHTNDVDRSSLYYHLFYEDTLGELRTMPKKDTRDAYVQWSDRIYSVLDDEFSGIRQMPFFETHTITNLAENTSDLTDSIGIYKYTIRPTPILSFYNDFPHQFAEEKMGEYYGFMTELMDYIVRRLRVTYALPATVDSSIRQSSDKKDEIIRILLSDTDTEDDMSILYGFRIVSQVIEESKKWIEEFYRGISQRGELNRYGFLESIVENITYYIIPMVHPDHPNEIQISISSYNYLYDGTVDKEKKVKLRQKIYTKWIESLNHAQDAMNGIPTMNHLPLLYIPSLRIHTEEYVQEVMEDELLEQDIHVFGDNIKEEVGEIDLENEVVETEDSNVKNIHIPSGSLSHRVSSKDYDEVMDDVDQYDISI